MVEDRRIEKSKQAIKDAFLHQLNTTGPSKITVTSLAAQANITRKTFYAHYKGLSQLADVLVDEKFQELHFLLVPLKEETEQPSLKFNARLVKFMQNNKTILQTLSQITDVSKGFKKLVFNDTQGVILKQLKRRQLPKQWDITKIAQNLSDFLTTGIYNTFESWLNDDNPLSTDELIYILYMLCIVPFEAPLSMNVSLDEIQRSKNE
ncbi:TetR/AcrR family transcriptional regulator [Ligilactobacillus pobuzihii]|uniref:HTH tetR-type domain-containing protein n=1 Tax=Ligilactobacillus pobuzihii TaxID=449659 RepID=A0A0R2LGR4_9LACO|nr:TetR/AcrR family transcriptional regulator [Ligilactobacillus pobuzihii]KRK09179.1 hypothetical protein FD11_GL001126 [Ligilactobacillus pobuzihii E100301 = KCTC 13174]KRN98490.1 hypothetical protein IV66_GL001820 [Ligilactobacillus pobuzihii]GEN48515.1 hypothetical protein LPO01_13070 [Ligilactobacillus pobuzihii]